MNIQQYFKALDVWAWLVLVFVISALALIAWMLIPFLGRLISKIWAKVLKKKDNLNRGEILVISIILEVLIATFFIIAVSLLPNRFFLQGGVSVLGFIVSLISVFLLVYFWWAPNNLFFTFVPEGMVKVIVKGDQFEKAIISWQEHILVTPKNKDKYPHNDLWDVVEGKPEKQKFGGLRFYGSWPLEDVYIYPFSWTSIRENGNKAEHVKEVLDYVMLKEDVYFCTMLNTEDELLLPADIEVGLPIRVINPYKALFVVQGWLEIVLTRVRAAIRNAYTQNPYAFWISSKEDLGEEIYKRLSAKLNTEGELDEENGVSFLIDECKGKYGIEVRATDVININPGEKFRQATLKGFLGQKEAERFAGEISYAVLNIMATGEGISFEEMQEKIKTDKKLLTKYTNFCLKRFTDKMAAESGSWVKIDASGGTGIKKDLLELFAGFIRMPQGKKQSKIKQDEPTEE